MTLHVERDGPVTTLIRNRLEARNAMDPASAEALTEALLAFDRDPDQSVAVLWGAGGAFCAGFDLKYAASLLGQKDPMAALDFPAGDGPGSARTDGADAAAAVQAGDRRGRRAGGRGRDGARAVVRHPRDGAKRLHGRLLPALGRAADRRRHRAAAAHRRAGQGARHHPDRPQGAGAGMLRDRAVRARWCRTARAARRRRRWRTRSRAFRKAACAPTAARCGCRRGCPRWTGCAPNGPARPPWWSAKGRQARRALPPARAGMAVFPIFD